MNASICSLSWATEENDAPDGEDRVGADDAKRELSRCSSLIAQSAWRVRSFDWEGQSRRDANRPGRGLEHPVETSAEERDGVIWDPIHDYHQGPRPTGRTQRPDIWLQPICGNKKLLAKGASTYGLQSDASTPDDSRFITPETTPPSIPTNSATALSAK
jgi:hypothetical protein